MVDLVAVVGPPGGGVLRVGIEVLDLAEERLGEEHLAGMGDVPTFVVVGATDPPTCTFRWMCTARPGYQPGMIVVIVHRPAWSVSWMPRRNVLEFVASSPSARWATPEYSPKALQCQMSTAARLTGLQV